MAIIKAMRILYGITKSNWGGAQRYVYDLALGAKNAGHEVSLLVGGDGILINKLEAEGVRVLTLPTMGRNINLREEIRNFLAIIKILKAERPDIFHLNSSKMGLLGALAGKILGIKTVFTAHGWAFNEPRHWAQKLLIEELAWLTVLLTHKTICVSGEIKRQMASKPLIKNKLVLIHNGISEFSTLGREKAREILAPNLPDEALLIGTLAELHKIKGLDVGIRGFSRAFKFGEENYVVLGDGEERTNLESLVEKLGLGAQVRLLGFKENARELLKGFDVFLFPSRSEGLPYALLEAGLVGLPTIASKVGGIPEVIKDGETGLLVAKEKPEAIAKALLELRDPELRKILGKRLQQFVLTHFSKEKMIAETLETYS